MLLNILIVLISAKSVTITTMLCEEEYIVTKVATQDDQGHWLQVDARPYHTVGSKRSNLFQFKTPSGCLLEVGQTLYGTGDDVEADFAKHGYQVETIKMLHPHIFGIDAIHNALMKITADVCMECPVYVFCTVVQKD